MKIKKVFAVCLAFSMIMLCGCDSESGKLFGSTEKKAGAIEDTGEKDIKMQSASRYAGGKIKEKNGDFFLWAAKDEERNKSAIYISQSDGTDGKKTVVQTAPKGYSIDETIVSDGESAYYTVLSENRDERFNTSGKVYWLPLPETEQKQVEEDNQDADASDDEIELEQEPEVLVEIDQMSSFIGYYAGLVYFARSSEKALNTLDLYSCDPETGQEECVKENFSGEQYGQYILGTPARHDPEIEFILLDLETGDETELPIAASMTMTEDYIVYQREGDEERSIHRCNLSGEEDEVLLELAEGDSCYYFGWEYAQILYEDGTMKQLNYADGSLEDIEFASEEIYAPVLNQYREALQNDLYQDVFNGETDDMSVIGEYINTELLREARSYKNYGNVNADDDFYIYYALSDLNDDGREELLIGAGSKSDIKLYGVFTQEAGIPFPLFDVSALGYRSNLYIHEDGTFSVLASGEYNTSEITHYYLPKKAVAPKLIETYGMEAGKAYSIDDNGNRTQFDVKRYETKVQKVLDDGGTLSWTKI